MSYDIGLCDNCSVRVRPYWLSIPFKAWLTGEYAILRVMRVGIWFHKLSAYSSQADKRTSKLHGVKHLHGCLLSSETDVETIAWGENVPVITNLGSLKRCNPNNASKSVLAGMFAHIFQSEWNWGRQTSSSSVELNWISNICTLKWPPVPLHPSTWN